MQITMNMVVGREAGVNGQCEASHSLFTAELIHDKVSIVGPGILSLFYLTASYSFVIECG